jgi:hypothetical protein
MIITLSILASCQGADTDFYVYHTRLDKQKKGVIESNLREDARQYQDVVVSIGDTGKFIFAYDSNYRPYWQTQKGEYPVKDIVKRQADTENNYSYARVLEKSAGKIVVHWRYYPKLTQFSYASAVHEYFEIHADGKVERRIVRARERLDEYLDKGNVAVQMLQLEDARIRELSYRPTRLLNEPGQPVEGAPVVSRGQDEPALWLDFDEGMKKRRDRYTVKDKVEARTGSINGGMALWKKGVSGTCLAFNGYNTSVSIPADEAPRLEDEFTVEAWVALGAYPWNNVPLIQQKPAGAEPREPEEDEEPEEFEETETSGYSLGVSTDGRPFFTVNNVRIDYGLISEMGLNQWHHVAGSVGDGIIKLYLDGRLVASSRVNRDEPLEIPDVDLVVGLNTRQYRMRPSEWHRGDAQNLPAPFGIEGLIDEVRVYTRQLADAEVKDSYTEIPPGLLRKADLQPRILPGEVDGKPAEAFGAYYTSLKYHDLWDNLWRLSTTPDVAVRFDLHPVAVTYWHGQNYAAGWVTENNRWMADQSCEEWGEHGCAEHMSDKQCRYCFVRIIENTPARAVVHWRYRSVDVGYKPGEQESYCWVDEYHTLYPDGAAVRRVSWNLNANPNPGWQDIQIFMQPGTDGDDHLHKHAMTMANLDGETEELNFTDGAPDKTIDHALIETVNFKSDYRVFMIAPEGSELHPWSNPFTGRWDHWPVGQYPSDGREAVALDRVAHTALSSGNNIVKNGNMAVYGLTNQPITSLIPLAKMWNHPPSVSNTTGCEGNGFYKPRRSFVIIAKDESMSFTINGSQTSPVFNPCLVIKNWNTNEEPGLNINGQEVRPGSHFRMGIERGTNGKQDLVIWVKMHKTSDVSFKIVGAKPDTTKPVPEQARWVRPPVLKTDDPLAVVMSAAKAHDSSSVKYQFECTNDSAASSNWLDTPEYDISGLIPNKMYRFRVRAKDVYNNYTDFSSVKTVTTGKARPAQASWAFDRGTGKKALDESGRYSASIRGAQRQKGLSGKGLNFDGRDVMLVDDYESFSTARDFSWSAWIKTTRGGAIIAHTAEEEQEDDSICLYVNEDGHLAFSCFFNDLFSDKTVNDGQWTHVALTGDIDEQGYDELTFYINGEPSGQVRINIDKFPGNGLPVKIGYGNREFPENGGFKGLMDEVKWYDYVLGPGHVREVYDSYVMKDR